MNNGSGSTSWFEMSVICLRYLRKHDDRYATHAHNRIRAKVIRAGFVLLSQLKTHLKKKKVQQSTPFYVSGTFCQHYRILS